MPGLENFPHPTLYTTLLNKGLSWGEHEDVQSETVFGTEAFLRTPLFEGKLFEGLKEKGKLFARRATCSEMNICEGRPFRPIQKIL